jgi:hypothetical protein
MVGGSNGTGAASRGAEWWPEVAGCGRGAAELRQSLWKVMIGGAHLSTRHREGRRRREVRCFTDGEAAIGQGSTDAWPDRPRRRARSPRGQGPVGRGRAADWGRKEEVGCGWAKN